MKKNSDKKMLFEMMHKVGGMPLNENPFDMDDASKVAYDNAMSDFPSGKYSPWGTPNVDWDNVTEEYKPLIEWIIDTLMSMDESEINNMIKMYGNKYGVRPSSQSIISRERVELIEYFLDVMSGHEYESLLNSNFNKNLLFDLYNKYLFKNFEARGEENIRQTFGDDL